MDVIHDLPSLQQAFRRKQKLKFLYFWGHVPKQAGVADQAVFSQWYPAPFELAGERYATAEHYMMAEKARLFGAEALGFARPCKGAGQADRGLSGRCMERAAV